MGNHNRFVIGIDGRGTKTAAQLCDLKGRILAEEVGDPSNFLVIGVEQTSRTILNLIEACCVKASMMRESLLKARV